MGIEKSGKYKIIQLTFTNQLTNNMTQNNNWINLNFTVRVPLDLGIIVTNPNKTQYAKDEPIIDEAIMKVNDQPQAKRIKKPSKEETYHIELMSDKDLRNMNERYYMRESFLKHIKKLYRKSNLKKEENHK